MKIRSKIIFGLCAVIFLLLLWAPMITEQNARELFVAHVYGYPKIPLNQTLAKAQITPTEENFEVSWIPFGKQVRPKDPSQLNQPTNAHCFILLWSQFCNVNVLSNHTNTTK